METPCQSNGQGGSSERRKVPNRRRRRGSSHRIAGRGNAPCDSCRRENDGVLQRQSIIASPHAGGDEPRLGIHRPGGRIRHPHFEPRRASTALDQTRQHGVQHLAARCPCDDTLAQRQYSDLRLVDDDPTKHISHQLAASFGATSAADSRQPSAARSSATDQGSVNPPAPATPAGRDQPAMPGADGNGRPCVRSQTACASPAGHSPAPTSPNCPPPWCHRGIDARVMSWRASGSARSPITCHAPVAACTASRSSSGNDPTTTSLSKLCQRSGRIARGAAPIGTTDCASKRQHPAYSSPRRASLRASTTPPAGGAWPIARTSERWRSAPLDGSPPPISAFATEATTRSPVNVPVRRQ